MPRLPIPGDDSGEWGAILNAYLREAHDETGGLKAGTVSGSTIQNGSIQGSKLTDATITEAKLDTALQAKVNATGGSGGTNPTMGGDLSGTASNAQIVAGAITNAEVATGAAIAQSKIANLTTDLAGKANTSSLAPVATSGAYADLTGRPTLPTTLGGLSDVDTAGAVSGQVLKFDGTGWGPDADASGGSAGDPNMGGDLSGTASNAKIVAGAITNTEVATGAAIAQSKIANLTTDLAGKAAAAHAHAAADITSGTIAAARLGAGSPSTSNFLRGDGTWATPSGGGGASSIGTEVLFSTLSGADDDAKLSAFMAAASASTLKGKTLVLDESRDYTFTQQQTLYSGFSIRGPFRPQDQARSSLPIGNRIRLRMTGGPKGWFIMPSTQVFGVSMTNLSIDGNANSRLIEGSSSGVLWTSIFRDISMQNGLSVMGSAAQPLTLTGVCIDGWWNVNNVQDRAFYCQGSDAYFSPSMFLLDSPPELLPANEFLANFSYLEKFTMRNFYITAETHSAILWGGGANAETSWIENCIIEGRNAGAPTLGSLIRVTGGVLDIHRSWLSYAMSNPAGTGRNDAGVIHVTGGDVFVDGCSYKRATGVAESVPFLYASGGKVRVRNIRGAGFTGKPVVRQTQAGLIDADESVTVITG